jgi:hypothetical protein
MMFGEQTSQHLRERFQLGLTQSATDAYLERLIVSSIGSNWTRLYDSVSFDSSHMLCNRAVAKAFSPAVSSNTTPRVYCERFV